MVFLKKQKPLPLSRLECKPPENMAMVHTILMNAVAENMDRIRHVEADYYGKGKKAEHEVSKWLPSVKAAMTEINVSFLTSASQIESINRMTGDPNRKFKIDTAHLAKTLEAYRKVIDCIPYKFKHINDDLKKLLKYLEMYCLSFYEMESGIDFDTGKDYEAKRKDWSSRIRYSIKCVSSLVEKFKKSDLLTNEFSGPVKELGHKTGCLQIAFLLIFPEICEQLRQAMRIVKEWVEADKNYVTFLSYDLADLEQRKDSFLRVVRDLQQRYSSLQFSLKSLEMRCDKLQDELNKLNRKENELTTEEEMLIEQSNEMQLEIDRKEWRRNELLRNAHVMHPEVMSEKFNEVCEILREVKANLPVVQRQLFAVRHKLSWISIKREEVLREHKKRDFVREEMEAIDEERVVQENEYETTVHIFELAKRIYTCKSTPDCVSKIFHEQPVEINNARLPGHKGADDPFESACNFVAMHIQDDWARLYRELPFVPERGQQTVDEDIAQLYQMKARLPVHEIAMRSLYRWRRFHTRAKLDDLLTTITKIRRFDLLRMIDRKLHPEKYKAVDIFASGGDEETKSEIEEYLLPYVRQIERYDKIRAHKIKVAAAAAAAAQ